MDGEALRRQRRAGVSAAAGEYRLHNMVCVHERVHQCMHFITRSALTSLPARISAAESGGSILDAWACSDQGTIGGLDVASPCEERNGEDTHLQGH